MALKLFNTVSGKKELFEPLEEGKIKMYVCGMTVYDYCHIGHARVMVGFDVITRFFASYWLRCHLY
jgi:cysteinyl-tRNA synthetase